MRRSSPPRPRMRSAAGTNGELVMPMLVHTLVMPFSMSSDAAAQHRIDRSGHERLERSHAPLLALDRLAEHDQHVGAGALLIAHVRDRLAPVFRQPGMRADGQVRQQRLGAGVGKGGQEVRRRGRRSTTPRSSLGNRRAGTIVVVGMPNGSSCSWPTSSNGRTSTTAPVWRAKISTTSSPIPAVDHRLRTTWKGRSPSLGHVNGRRAGPAVSAIHRRHHADRSRGLGMFFEATSEFSFLAARAAGRIVLRGTSRGCAAAASLPLSQRAGRAPVATRQSSEASPARAASRPASTAAAARIARAGAQELVTS